MTVERSSAPPATGRIQPRLPEIRRSRLENGARIASTVSSATPETLIELVLPGGGVHESLEHVGLASLVAKTMLEGTTRLSTVELIDALDFLGADLRVTGGDEGLVLSLRVLDKHLPRALELLFDVLLEPRFDPSDFERVRKLRLATLAARGDDAGTVAAHVWSRLMYGEASILGWPALGTENSVARLTVDDLWSFHRAALDPTRTRIAIVGRWDADDIARLLAPLERRWPSAVDTPHAEPELAIRSAPPGLYCVDRPEAPQTDLHLGHMSLSARAPQWLALSGLNYPLGGQFTSRINLHLREKRGFTYGARSAFEAATWPAPFAVHTTVHAQHTAAAIRETRDELRGFLDGPTEAELEFTRDALEQSLARQFESPAARLGYLRTVERFGWPDDYPLVRLARLAELGQAGLRDLARAQIAPERLVVLAVGRREELAGLEPEFGAPRMLDIDGAPL